MEHLHRCHGIRHLSLFMAFAKGFKPRASERVLVDHLVVLNSAAHMFLFRLGVTSHDELTTSDIF